MRLDEIEKKDERISVRSDGAGAQGTLLGEVFGKERLDQRREGWYRTLSSYLSHKWIFLRSLFQCSFCCVF